MPIVPPVHPLVAIAAQMRENLGRAKIADPAQGDYHCSYCKAHLLRNPTTMEWESEEHLALCPSRSKASKHSPSLWVPEGGEDGSNS